jgi:hypothetical protein
VIERGKAFAAKSVRRCWRRELRIARYERDSRPPATSSQHRHNAEEMGDDHPHITQTTVRQRPNQVGRKHPPQTALEG